MQGFGILRVVIRNDIFDPDFSSTGVPARAFKNSMDCVELRARGQQVIAIGESPAVILDVGELDARGAGRFGDSEHLLELIDVAAVNDEIECDSDAMALQPFEDAEFLRVGFGAGDFVGDFFARALKAQLKVIEAGFDEMPRGALRREASRR